MVIAILVSGCVASNTNYPDASEATSKCRQACMDLQLTRMDFSNGPCINDNIIADWVCDVVHEPRQPIDDVPANQCPSFGIATHHFVEVNENCRIIRVV